MQYTIQHRTVLIIFRVILQTIISEQMSTGRDGEQIRLRLQKKTKLHSTSKKYPRYQNCLIDIEKITPHTLSKWNTIVLEVQISK